MFISVDVIDKETLPVKALHVTPRKDIALGLEAERKDVHLGLRAERKDVDLGLEVETRNIEIIVKILRLKRTRMAKGDAIDQQVEREIDNKLKVVIERIHPEMTG